MPHRPPPPALASPPSDAGTEACPGGASGEPLTRVTLQIPGNFDAFRAAAAHPTGCRALWRSPAEGHALAAFGAAAELRLAEPDPLRAQRWCSRIYEQIRGLDAAAPTLLGGWAFDGAARPGDEAWSDWPRLWLLLPEVLVATSAEGASISAFHRHPATARQLAEQAARALAKSRSAVELAAPPSVRGRPRRQVPDAAGYQELVRDVVKNIAGGALAKVVLARRQELVARGGFDPRASALELAALHPSARVFGFFDGGRAFVGATPELLARVERGRLTSQALAGTCPAGAGRLLDSLKDRHEQRLVVDGILRALAPLCDALEAPPEPVVQSAGPIDHLSTPIAGRLRRGAGLLEVAAALHPTAALAGTPRSAALAYLREHEPFDRGWYGGPVGWLAPDGGVLAVAIRSMLVERGRAFAYAGAGIVAGSDPELEWRETEAKLRAARGALVGHARASAGEEARA